MRLRSGSVAADSAGDKTCTSTADADAWRLEPNATKPVREPTPDPMRADTASRSEAAGNGQLTVGAYPFIH